jgi:catechol 2,3-dioxygenase-like lactoylglutathione lyase family enzyme
VIAGMNHVGMSVVSLERSMEFYCDLFHMEVVVKRIFDGEQYAGILGLPGTMGRVALLRGTNLQLELFEFSTPVPKPAEPHRPVSDHGISHFCVEVKDIEMEYQRLRAAGVSFHCPPLNFAGIAKATYGRDPDGNVFEMFESLSGSADR